MKTKSTYAKKRKNRKPNKRNYRRRVKGSSLHNATGKAKMLTLRGGMGFPDIYMCPMRYVGTYQFYPDVFHIQTFRVNSCYDIDLTNVGHQPLYFDQLTAVYTNYEVTAFKMDVKIVNQSTTTNSQVCCGFTAYDPSSQFYQVLAEQPFAKTVEVGLGQGNNRAKMSIYGSTKRVEGYKAINQIPQFWGTASTNPTFIVYGFVCVRAIDGISANNCFIEVDITQYVKWFDRKIQTLSLTGASGATGDHHSPSSAIEVIY